MVTPSEVTSKGVSASTPKIGTVHKIANIINIIFLIASQSHFLVYSGKVLSLFDTTCNPYYLHA
ncbi:MAG: hypothetical protein NPMRTH1_230010 [Nitrosopumilales archaeon]|nr:MAG: hypothetical protein NPMRTH1_230010 [Nitrosopumilales archaeon]